MFCYISMGLGMYILSLLYMFGWIKIYIYTCDQFWENFQLLLWIHMYPRDIWWKHFLGRS
jgi:hypothetical protein